MPNHRGWYACTDVQEWRRDYSPELFGVVRRSENGYYRWAIYIPEGDGIRGKLQGWNGGCATLDAAQVHCSVCFLQIISANQL